MIEVRQRYAPQFSAPVAPYLVSHTGGGEMTMSSNPSAFDGRPRIVFVSQVYSEACYGSEQCMCQSWREERWTEYRSAAVIGVISTNWKRGRAIWNFLLYFPCSQVESFAPSVACRLNYNYALLSKGQSQRHLYQSSSSMALGTDLLPRCFNNRPSAHRGNSRTIRD